MGVIILTDERIKRYLKNDILKLDEYPVDEIAEYYKPRVHKQIDLTVFPSLKLREEMKTFIMLLFSGFNGFSYKSKIVIEIFKLVPFLATQNISSIFDIDSEDLIQKYVAFRGIEPKIPTQLINNIYFFLTEYNDPREGLDRDIWYIDKMPLEEERINKAKSINTLNFTHIKNTENRDLVKKYVKILLSSYFSVSTIANELSLLTHFCNFIKDKPLFNVTRNDCDKYFHEAKKENLSTNRYNKKIYSVYDLFEYLISKKLYLGQNPVNTGNKITEARKKKLSAPPDFVILQIFNNLHLLPFDLMVMFIINYATGLRVSDICQLEIDCTCELGGYYFVKHKVQKMRKYQVNIIPTAAYKLIKQQQANVLAKNPNAKYLFPASKKNGAPCNIRYYTKHMGEYIESWNVKNENGTPYHFESHGYRHKISTVLQNEYGVDLSIIQLGVLGHTEINMSLCYAEHDQNRRTRFEKNYVGIDGEVNGLISDVDREFLVTAEWMRQNIETQTLPNGVCSYPMKLGVCPHFEACLTCPYFRTSIDYLELHKQHLAKLENDIIIYEGNGWLPNLQTAIKQKEALIKIINALEKHGGKSNDSAKA